MEVVPYILRGMMIYGHRLPIKRKRRKDFFLIFIFSLFRDIPSISFSNLSHFPLFCLREKSTPSLTHPVAGFSMRSTGAFDCSCLVALPSLFFYFFHFRFFFFFHFLFFLYFLPLLFSKIFWRRYFATAPVRHSRRLSVRLRWFDKNRLDNIGGGGR